jgi:NitT/TauT family transport system substrate-binding protein
MSMRKNIVSVLAAASVISAVSAACAAPEQSVVRWNYGTSGNILVTIASSQSPPRPTLTP